MRRAVKKIRSMELKKRRDIRINQLKIKKRLLADEKESLLKEIQV